MKFICAPMQGLTEAPWREIMAQRDCGIDEWCAPFVRIEKGEPRLRDIRDILPENNLHQSPTSQVIFRDVDEFRTLVDAIISLGYNRIDLNLGCPFPLQTAKGRGCRMLTNVDELERVAQCMALYPDIDFSAKMRLGMHRPDEWRDAAKMLNAMPLRHITVHPRTAKMQYKGEPILDAFAECTQILTHPIVYNGDIQSPADIAAITRRFTNLHGIMIGRGLIARPTLVAEYLSGHENDDLHLRQILEDVMQSLADALSAALNDDNQVLAKLKTYWAECHAIVDHKTAKAIKKARTLAAYHQILTNITTEAK